jgi:hypothetical protein
MVLLLIHSAAPEQETLIISSFFYFQWFRSHCTFKMFACKVYRFDFFFLGAIDLGCLKYFTFLLLKLVWLFSFLNCARALFLWFSYTFQLLGYFRIHNILKAKLYIYHILVLKLIFWIVYCCRNTFFLLFHFYFTT